jgi:hypothetical protein
MTPGSSGRNHRGLPVFDPGPRSGDDLAPKTVHTIEIHR